MLDDKASNSKFQRPSRAEVDAQIRRVHGIKSSPDPDYDEVFLKDSQAMHRESPPPDAYGDIWDREPDYGLPEENEGSATPPHHHRSQGNSSMQDTGGNLPASHSRGNGVAPHIRTAAELKNMQFLPLRYTVPGYIADGCTILAGRPKLGKSWLVLQIGLAVALGETCLGSIRCEQGDVLCLALEDNDRRLHSRIDKLMPNWARTDWPAAFHYETTWPRANDGGLKLIEEWLDEHPHARLIIIDVLAQFRSIVRGKEQAYDVDYRAIKGLQEIASKRNVAIVIVHHTRKSQSESGDPFETVSGTLGLSGAADTTLVLDRNGQGCTLYGRGRDIEEIESAVMFDQASATWVVQGNVTDVRRSDERGNILDALLDAEEALTPSVIASVTGMKNGNVRRLLNSMVKAGEVEKAGYGKYVHPRFSQQSPRDTS